MRVKVLKALLRHTFLFSSWFIWYLGWRIDLIVPCHMVHHFFYLVWLEVQRLLACVLLQDLGLVIAQELWEKEVVPDWVRVTVTQDVSGWRVLKDLLLCSELLQFDLLCELDQVLCVSSFESNFVISFLWTDPKRAFWTHGILINRVKMRPNLRLCKWIERPGIRVGRVCMLVWRIINSELFHDRLFNLLIDGFDHLIIIIHYFWLIVDLRYSSLIVSFAGLGVGCCDLK